MKIFLFSTVSVQQVMNKRGEILKILSKQTDLHMNNSGFCNVTWTFGIFSTEMKYRKFLEN